MTEGLPELLAKFEAHLRGDVGYADLTVRSYMADMRHCVGVLQGELDHPVDLADLTRERLQAYLRSLTLNGQRKARTVHRHASALTAFFRYVAGVRRLCDDEARYLIRPRPGPPPIPQVLTAEQMEFLVEAPIRLAPGGRVGVFCRRDAAILEVFYATGLRVSELSRLNVSDLKFWPGGYCAFRSLRKRRKDSLLVIEKGKVLKALHTYLAHRAEIPGAPDTDALFVGRFGKRIGRRGIYKIVRKWGRRCGMKAWPHLLRHGFGTVMVEAAGENLRGVQELMAHSDPRMTAQYDRINEARIRRTAALHPRAEPVPQPQDLLKRAGLLLLEAGRLFGHLARQAIERARARAEATRTAA